MPRFTRKPKVVVAMQLSPENLHIVEVWSKGKSKAELNEKIGGPRIRITCLDKVGGCYADFGWWLLIEDDGYSHTMHPKNFKREYQLVYT